MLYSTVPATRVNSSFFYGFIGGKASYKVANATEFTKWSKKVPENCFVLTKNNIFTSFYHFPGFCKFHIISCTKYYVS